MLKITLENGHEIKMSIYHLNFILNNQNDETENVVKGKELKPGMFVGLNQRTHAIVDIFPVSSEQLKKARESFFVTEYTWKVAEED